MKLVMSENEVATINALLKKIKQPTLHESIERYPFMRENKVDGLVEVEITQTVFKRVIETINKCIDDIYNPITLFMINPIIKRIRKEVQSIEHISSSTATAVNRLKNLVDELVINENIAHGWHVGGKLVVSIIVDPHTCEVKVNHNLLTSKISREVINELSLVSTNIRLSLNERRRFISPAYSKSVDLNLRRIDDAINHFNLQFKKLSGGVL